MRGVHTRDESRHRDKRVYARHMHMPTHGPRSVEQLEAGPRLVAIPPPPRASIALALTISKSCNVWTTGIPARSATTTGATESCGYSLCACTTSG